MGTSPSIYPPLKTECFLQGEGVTIGQELGVVVIHTDRGQVQASVIPGQIHIPKDDLRGWCDESWDQRLLLRPLA